MEDHPSVGFCFFFEEHFNGEDQLDYEARWNPMIVLVPVSDHSDVFQCKILAPLQSAYLYEESKQSFRYKSAVLLKNEQLEKKYNAFRAKRRQAGYSEEDLRETFGFLSFDSIDQAHALGETGILTGKSGCTTLGDPLKGVYISMYSDCLDIRCRNHGKSGYIAIIRLTKGRVRRVPENYTQNFTAPTVGFDCHESEELSSVSAKKSSIHAFERTQYYLYELLDDVSGETAVCPSAACPFAVVSFSYTDTKAILVTPKETSEKKKLVCDYLAWTGQLQIGTQSFDVGLRSTKGALIPTKLPPVVKVERAISMFDLMQLLPRSAFETCFSGEVSLGGLYCSLYQLVPSEVQDTNSLARLLQEIKEKDLALTVPLNDGGFLILLHSSHFSPCHDKALNQTEVLHSMFIFPGSRVIRTGTRSGQTKATVSSEILQALPVLSYAEAVVEKTPLNSTEEPCEVLAQHMQSFPECINPGLDLSTSREAGLFPNQYDVLDDHKQLYSSPDWTDKAQQSFKSYMSKPVSFQLPVSLASEILAAEKGEQREGVSDNIHGCLSFPEEAPTNRIGMGSVDQLTDQKSPVHGETSVENCPIITGAQVDSIKDLQAEDHTDDNSKSDLTVLMKTCDAGAKTTLSSPTSDDMSAELIVSITSAERTVTDESLNVISSMSATKHDDFQVSGFSAAKSQTAGVSSLHDVKIKSKDCPEVPNITETIRRKVRKGHSKVWPSLKKKSKACVETESSGHSQFNNLSKIYQRKLRNRKSDVGKLVSKRKKVRCATLGLAGQQSLEKAILRDFELCPLRKKTERWDLKPVISECGRILVPHGSVDVDRIQSLKHKSQCTINERPSVKMLIESSVNDNDKKVQMEQESNTVLLTEKEKTDAIIPKDGRNPFQNIVASWMNNKQSLFGQSDKCLLPLHPVSNEHPSKNDRTNTPPTEEVKGSGAVLTGKLPKKGEFNLSKLKSVLLQGKRKKIGSEETMEGVANTKPCLKKFKDDTEALETFANVQNTNVEVKEVTNLPSVDCFAYALGQTPKEKPDKVEKSEGGDSQYNEDSTETQGEVSTKQSQILQKPPPIFTRRGRIKTLKKRQGISADNIKRKWWLHFQMPTHFPTDKLKHGCFRDNPVSQTGVEKLNNACSSTEALNLLADLALSASIIKVPPQPALEKKPEMSFKKCGPIKDVPSAEQESLLHVLLRQPAAGLIQSLENSSPKPHVGDSELVGSISREHSYSLPASFPVLLDLPGTPFQVTPLSGSTRLLHHQPNLNTDGVQTVQLSGGQEGRGERSHCKISESLKKCLVRRQKFRYARTFVNKDGSVQVTRRWKESYDFNRDSKFASDSKGSAIIRALHGPWDFSTQDTAEEVQLIVHIWIGLFYSRSTSRFYHVDSNFKSLFSEESDSLELSSEITSAPAQSENRANSLGGLPCPTSQDHSISKVLDLSKNDNSEHGSVILDLSLRNSCAETVTLDPQIHSEESSGSSELKEASDMLNTLKSARGQQEARPLQCNKLLVRAPEIIVNDLRSHCGNDKTCRPSQKAEDDGPFTHVQEEVKSVSVGPGKVPGPLWSCPMSRGCITEKTHVDVNRKKTTEIGLVQKHATDSPKSMTDEEAESNKEADDVLCTDNKDEIHPKDGEKWEDESTKKQLGIVWNGNCFETKEQPAMDGPKPVPEKVAKDMNSHTDSKGEIVAAKDHCGKEDELSENESCASNGSDLSYRSLHIVCDSLESLPDCCTDGSRQAPFDEKPPRANHDTQLGKPCTNDSALTDDHAISEEALPENEAFSDGSADKENPDDTPWQKASQLASGKSICSFIGSSAAGFILQTKDSLEMRGCDDPNDQKTKSVVLERKDNNASQELCHRQSHSSQFGIVKTKEDKEALTTTDLKMKTTDEGLEKAHSEVVIPFVTANVVELPLSHPQGKIVEVKGQKGIPFNNVSAHPVMSKEEEEVYAGKSNQTLLCGSESDDRCPTPLLDEVVTKYVPCPPPGSSTDRTRKTLIPRCLSRNSTRTNHKNPLGQKLYCTSSVDNYASTHSIQPVDVEQRTQNVLQCLDQFLTHSKLGNKSKQIETTDAKNDLDQKPYLRSKYPSTSSTADFTNKELSYLKPVAMLPSTSQELHQESSSHSVSPHKNKFPLYSYERTEETSKAHDYCPASGSAPPAEFLQDVKPNFDQDGLKTKSPSNLDNGPCSCSHRPVMAVKPSKNDESQSDHTSRDGHNEFSPTSTTPTTMPMEKTKFSEFSTKGYGLLNVSDSNTSSDQAAFAHLDPPDHYQRRNMIISPALSKQPVESSKSDGNQGFFPYCLLEKVDEKEDTEASKLFGDDNDSITEENLIPGPQTSLTCTVFNTGRKSTNSFLEQVSRRCIQEDPTQASMEQECLIFSEQMKQLLKRSKRGQISEQDTDDKLRSSCASPLTVRFSSLEEQEGSLDLLDAHSLAGQKFKVDMCDRKNPKVEKTMHPQKAPPRADELKKHADVSGVTTKCATIYEAMMDDICGVGKAPLRPQSSVTNNSHKNIEPSNLFDFCDQMKREIDESFRSQLNSVVKKYCKTKYRFYILETSDDSIFEEAKAQLESMGHTPIQPSEFFLGGGSSSSLLIILRNEDIAEHICEVPHLLELKKSPGVQFAGIDEPDDVVNLTHQELFTQGGFLMFDRAALESLSLCDMKKCSDILQELSRAGKWKWMLHYRDNRWLKENARLSAEAKEKKCFLNSCQDSGILEFLPYHKCDIPSRDQPDYLTCLVCLQVQNISARYPLFITDIATEDTFGRNGIVTMTVNSFLTTSLSETLL